MTALSDYLVPTTALQAVNVMLASAGEKAVLSLDASAGSMANTAIQRLGETNMEVQAEGWSYNRDEAMPLDPALDGTITLPAGTLKIGQLYYQASVPAAGAPAMGNPATTKLGMRLVRRGNRLYDNIGHTFNIGRTVYVDIVVVQDFETIPQGARWYITCKAARRLASGKLVSGTVYQFTKADEDEARLRMEQEEDEATQLDGLAGNPHLQLMRRK